MPGETARWRRANDTLFDRCVAALKHPGIGAWLFALAVAALLPVLVFASVVAHQLATAERRARLTDLEHRTEAAANKVERYLQTLRELAVTLANSPEVLHGDLQAFYDFAKRAMEAGNVGRAVALADPDGRMLLNTRRPFGEKLPNAGDVEGIAEALARKSVHIANLFTGAVTVRHVFTAWAPVIRDGQVKLLVGVTVEPEDLTTALREERLREGWVGQVIDRKSIIVARTLAPEIVVGQPAVPEAAAAHATGTRGAYALINKEGVSVSAYFVKLPSNGWTVALGVPTRQLEESVKYSLQFILALGLAALSTAGGLAFLVGRQMSRRVASVAHAAMAVGDGREPTIQPSNVRELDEVSSALAAARALIDARETALRESEADFRGYFEHVAVGTAQIDPNGRFRRVNERYCEITGYSREELLNGMGPIDLDHPDDRDADRERLASFFKGQTPVYEAEKRYVRKGGQTVWVRVTATHVRGAIEHRNYTAGVISDITERKRAEEHAVLLMKEVNHRAKNLLAVVQAVALQTAGEGNPEVFAEAFSERLAGLAACHDLLVRSEWQGVDAGDLLRSQLIHFTNLIGTRVILDGPPVQLKPTAAQAIGMAIHELATNAGKYGSLSNTAGSVRIVWENVANNAQPLFQMRWSEHGGPPPAPPQHRGYGHRVMTEMVEYTLGADVSLDLSVAFGLVWF